MKDKLLEIISFYGIDKQLKYIHSEYFELDEAIINYIDDECNYYSHVEDCHKKNHKEHIAEELADVMVMLKQFQYYYGIPDEEIEKIMNEKIDRQLERIKKNDEDTIKWLKEHNENAFKKHNILEIEEPKEVVVIEKEEYECLKEENQRLNNVLNELKWKPIEEYDRKKYDWVLVKYFDKDYECVPCVAEKRWGKWYSESEMEIQFDVKYFFDMQQLDKLNELKESDK